MNSASKENFYDILQIERQAQNFQIKEAYRRLALQRHPDKNPGDPRAVAAFQKVCTPFCATKFLLAFTSRGFADVICAER